MDNNDTAATAPAPETATNTFTGPKITTNSRTEYYRIAAGQRTSILVETSCDIQPGDMIRIDAGPLDDKRIAMLIPLYRRVTHVLHNGPGMGFGYVLVNFEEVSE